MQRVKHQTKQGGEGMEIIIKGSYKEIAELILKLQAQLNGDMDIVSNVLGETCIKVQGKNRMANQKTDEEFNSMIYDSILPCIAQAFCSLEKGITGNELECHYNADINVVIEKKARQMKDVITTFIDGQVEIQRNLFKE